MDGSGVRDMAESELLEETKSGAIIAEDLDPSKTHSHSGFKVLQTSSGVHCSLPV